MSEKRTAVEARLFVYAPMFAASTVNLKKEKFSNEMLKAVYSGKKKKWSDGTPVIPVFRESGDSGFLTINKQMPLLYKAIKKGEAAGIGKFCYTEDEVADYLNKVAGSIGFTDTGVFPAKGTKLHKYALYTDLQNKKPLVRPLYILSHKQKNKGVSDFIKFCFSDYIKSFVKEQGYIPGGGLP
jgi:ABC-type phosphate transport system substrate-binding protein